MSISAGVLANENVESDILSAKEKGQVAFDTFLKTRIKQREDDEHFRPNKKDEVVKFF